MNAKRLGMIAVAFVGATFGLTVAAGTRANQAGTTVAVPPCLTPTA